MIYVRAIDGMTNHTAGDLRSTIGDLIGTEGVLDLSTHLEVTENDTPDMSVNVAPGVAYVLNDDWTEFASLQKYWDVLVDAEENAVITANSSGSTRYDLICLFVDTTVDPDANASNVATVEVVAGTPGAGQPATPDNHLLLAVIEVADGATTIETDDITDSRVQMAYSLKTANISTLTTDNLNLNANGIGNVVNSSMARQAIINGNFDVWQRGTTVNAVDSINYLIADRWGNFHRAGAGGTLPTITTSRQTHTAGDIYGAYYFYRISPNGAGTSFATNAIGTLYQKIEHGTRLLCGDGKTVTVSFWARSSIANKRLGIRLTQNYGTGGSPTAAETINGTNWTLTSTWTKYTHTFTTNTLAGKTFGTANDDHIILDLAVSWGSSYQTSFGASSVENYVGSGNIDIAQVQLCAGSVALPFQPKSYAEELRACQRYYYHIEGGTQTVFGFGYNATTTVGAYGGTYPVSMRIAPTAILQSGTAANYEIAHGATSTACSAVVEYRACTTSTWRVSATVASGLTAGQGSLLRAVNTSGYLGWSAEL